MSDVSAYQEYARAQRNKMLRAAAECDRRGDALGRQSNAEGADRWAVLMAEAAELAS